MLKAVVIGCGNIGTYAHVPNLRNMPGVELVSVCDVIEERAKSCASKFSIRNYHTDPYVLLSTDDVDLAVIATPPDTHLELTEFAVSNGKHVFLEKPLSSNLVASHRIHELAHDNPRVKVMPGFCLRFNSMFKHVKELIDSSKIGKPILLWRANFGKVVGLVPPAPWVPVKSKSGGMLVENMIHTFDALRWFAGDYDSAYGEVMTMTPGIDIEDNAAAVLRFKSGARATITQSWTASHSWDSWGVIGTHGFVSVDGYVSGPMRVSFDGGPQMNIVIEEDPILMYRRELEAFVDFIETGRAPSPNVEDGLKAQEVAVAVQVALERGVPVKVPP